MKSMFPNLFTNTVFDEMMEVLDKSPNMFCQNNSGYPVDILEIRDDNGNASKYEIVVALAGIKKENIDVGLDGDDLLITAKKTSEEEDKTRVFLQKGISKKAMELRYRLNGIDKAGIKSSFKDGLLKIELPLLAEVKAKKIEIDG